MFDIEATELCINACTYNVRGDNNIILPLLYSLSPVIPTGCAVVLLRPGDGIGKLPLLYADATKRKFIGGIVIVLDA
jgi:hypothetical protein